MSLLDNATFISAAIGIISMAAMFFYNIIEKRQHSNMNNNIDKVNRKVLVLQAELDELRKSERLSRKEKRRIRKQSYIKDNSYSGVDNVDIDAYSVAGTDVGDDEFFDCSDYENSDDETRVNEEDDPALLELFEECEQDIPKHSYDKLKKALKKYPYNVEIVWRFARSCYHCSLEDDTKVEDYINEGCDACEKVLDVEHGKLYEVYAILIGIKSRFLPVKEKLLTGFCFKKYLDKALQINPNNGYLYYLMGRFKFEISELNWFQKKVATTFIAELPTGNIHDAISDFKKAEELSKEPNYVNKLYLGKSFIALGKFEEGVSYLSQVKDIKTTNTEEEKVLNEAEYLFKKYSNYT